MLNIYVKILYYIYFYDKCFSVMFIYESVKNMEY